MKKIIINADDFGLTASVTRGVLKAHKCGIVSSTTVMVNRPYAQKALNLSKFYPKLGVGLHLVFNKDKPTLKSSKVKTLINENGYFHKDTFQFKEKISLSELKKEFINQVLTFKKFSGKLPDHIDCHHWGILYPPFFKIYIEVAEKFNIPVRTTFLKLSKNEDVENLVGNFHQEIKNQDKLIEIYSKSRVKSTDNFVHNFFGGDLDINFFNFLIDNIEEGTTEIMVHPGFNDTYLEFISSYSIERENELEILISSILKEKLIEKDIKIINFRKLGCDK